MVSAPPICAAIEQVLGIYWVITEAALPVEDQEQQTPD